jgi:hypothetical protein
MHTTSYADRAQDTRRTNPFGRRGLARGGDVLLLGTEAGIDVALFWNGRGYIVNAPKEEP